MNQVALRKRFADLWRRLGAEGNPRPALESVLRAWQEPHRHYHGLDHLRDCLAQLDEAPASGRERDLAETALWYHDMVYLPAASDNEARSAELARASLLAGGVAEATADEVARLVRLTDHRTPAGDPVAALVCDVDLSILGRSPEEFAAYERSVREEYRQIPEPLYRSARARVLAGLLAHDPLFRTDHFRSRYEAPARDNLRRSLDTLAGGVT